MLLRYSCLQQPCVILRLPQDAETQQVPLWLYLVDAHAQVKAEERLGFGGADEIRAHPWFDGLDWAALEARDVPGPIAPALSSPFDTSNFDEFVDPPPAPRFPPGQADPNAAVWAELWDWVEQPSGGPSAAALSRRASGAGPGLAALRAASLSLRASAPEPSAAQAPAVSVMQQAQERLATLQLQQMQPQTALQEGGSEGPSGAVDSQLPFSSGLAEPRGKPGAGLEGEREQHAASQQTDGNGTDEPAALPAGGLQASAFAAASMDADADRDVWDSDGSGGSPVRASLPPIAVSRLAVRGTAADRTGAVEAGPEHNDGGFPRSGSGRFPGRPASVSLPEDLPVYAASADGLVSPLASAGRIDLSGEMSEKGHFVITAGGLVNPAANAGKIVLELDATDTDKFMALDSGIVSPTANSGRVILLPDEPAKGGADAL